MAQSRQPFTAYKGIECAICFQPAHGQHFGVLSCRPCAAFFKRCILEKSKYSCIRGTNQCTIKSDSKKRKCKACRLRLCKLAGMEFERRRRSGKRKKHENWEQNSISSSSDADGEEGEQVGHPIANLAFMDKLVAAYDQFLAHQKMLFTKTYRNAKLDKITMFIPEKVQYIHKFNESIKTLFVGMFTQSLDMFAQMDRENKMSLIEECFAHLNFLNACHLSLRHFPSKNDKHFLIAYGHVMDMDRIEDTLGQWAIPNIFEQKEMLTKKYNFIQQIKMQNKKCMEKEEDICALMAIIFCIKAASSFGVDAALWDATRRTILREWHQMMCHRVDSQKKATRQYARLLALLIQMDMLLLKEHKMAPPSLAQFTTVEPLNNLELNAVEFICRITCSYKRIWTNVHHESSDNYIGKIEQFDKFEDLLASTENILALYDKFPEEKLVQICGPVGSAVVREMGGMEKMTWHPKFRRKNIIFRLLNMGVLRAMPIFHQLPILDQAMLHRKVGPALNAFITAYYAAEIGASTMVDPEGVSAMATFGANKILREDRRFISLAEKTFSRTADHFLRIPLLTQNEFSLLLAILSSHSAISGLSEGAKELLYGEEVRYSAILLLHLQTKLGPENGAKRYAENMHLINTALYSSHYFELMKTYLEAFHSRQGFTSEIFPKCLVPLV